jgi:membrane-associated phospholipid phosphatase
VSDRPGRPSATDLALLLYCAAAVALLALDGRALGERRLALAAGHALVAALALALARADNGREGGWARFAHRWLPLVALAWLYGWAGEMRHLVAAADFDPLVEAWDEALFAGHWHLAGARLPLPLVELAHAAYFSYYLILFVPALAAGRRRARDVDRYLFWLTAAMLTHYAANLLFPVAGPLAARAATMPEGVLFVPLMDGFYGGFDRGGLAFPSTHVVAALVAAWFAGRVFFPRAALAYAAWFAAIAASTVLCGYHYPVDVLAGLVTGGLFVALAARTRRRPGGAGAAAGAGVT